MRPAVVYDVFLRRKTEAQVGPGCLETDAKTGSGIQPYQTMTSPTRSSTRKYSA